MITVERLRDALLRVDEIIGPRYVETETCTLLLDHDRGMRLRSLLLAEFMDGDFAECRQQLEQLPTPGPYGYRHRLQLGEVTIEWPARRITLAPGHYVHV